jgi:large-conductance mechanosensitive channel
VLGVLVGVVVTLILIAICIVIFVKIKNKVRLYPNEPQTVSPSARVNKAFALNTFGCVG